MRHKIEFHPNSDCVTIHLQKRLINKMIESFNSPDEKIRVYRDNVVIKKLDPPIFVKRLWEVDGIEHIYLHPYSVGITKGTAFDWNDMLERIIIILNLELFSSSEPEQLGEPIRPSEELLKCLREQGCEV